MNKLPWAIAAMLTAGTARAQDRVDRADRVDRPRPPVRLGATTVTVIDENQSVEEVISRVRERAARERVSGPDAKARPRPVGDQRRAPGQRVRSGGAERAGAAVADRARKREQVLERQRERRGAERRRIDERRQLRRLGR